jgi:nucleotide-binding universal stress UspA family protein
MGYGNRNQYAADRADRALPIARIMNAFEHILVPIDFGEPAEYALDFAATLASQLGSKLTLMHASWVPPPVYAGAPDAVGWPTDDLAKIAREKIDDKLAELKERCPNADGVVVIDEPWPGILRVAEERGADLVVMGTHGRRGLSRALLGSVAERVVRSSPIPVLTVMDDADRRAREDALRREPAKR